MANYHPKLMKEDPISFLNKMFLFFTFHPIAYKLYFVLCMYFVIQELVYMVVMSLSFQYLKQFFTILASNTFALTVFVGLAAQEKQFRDSIDELLSFAWALDSGGQKLYQEFKHSIFLAKLRLVINIFVAVAIFLGFIPFRKIDYDGSMHLYLYFLNKLDLPTPIFIFIVALYYILNGFMFFTMTCYVNSIQYFTIHFRFQFDLLKMNLRMIGRDYIDGMEVLLDDEEYQENVYKRLILCHKYYIRLIQYCNKIVDQLSVPLFFQILGCVQLEIAYVASTIMFHGFECPLGSVILFAGSAIITIQYFYYYQVLFDQIDEVRDSAVDTYWESWNVKNRRCLLLLLSNCSRPLYYTGLGFFRGNWQLLIWIVHKVVNVVSAIFVMSN